MQNAGLEEAQAGIKIARRNIDNFRYADDAILMAESEGELKSLLMKVKEESEKVGSELNIQKTKIMASGPIASWQIDGEQWQTLFWGGSKITADGDCSHEIKRRLLLVIAYGEQCPIRDLRRRFNFGTREQAWSLKSFCVAEFYSSVKGREKGSDMDIRRGMESAPLCSVS